MADSILSSLLSKASLTIVKSADGSGGNNLAQNLQVSRVAIKYRARAMRHMREDGTSIVDSRVIDPVTIDLEVICPTMDELGIVNDLLKDRKDTYKFTSKGITVYEVVMDDMMVKQTPEMISASPVRLTFKQLLRQGGVKALNNPVVEQEADSSIFARGIQTVKTVANSTVNTFSTMIGKMLV